MSMQTLPSTTDDILRLCPRFRILLVGKSGVGKSSLIKDAFNVDYNTISHREHGICDINDEITSTQNPRFVVHDSQGFEHGEVGNLKKVETFLQQRGDGAELKDRVHAVWLCVQVPFAGGRVFEVGDEQLLKLGLKVPIVVVFTQFDRLISRMEQAMTDDELDLPEEEVEALALQRADGAFKKSCVDILDDVRHNLPYAKVSVKSHHRSTLANLINITQELVSRHVEGDVWIVSAMAQRASAQAKIDSSVEVGMKQYWQGLASSTRFTGVTLQICLNTIHTEITSSWNFNDPDNLLDGEEFRDKIMSLVQLVIPEPSDLQSWFSQSLETIQCFIGVASTLASVIAPVAAAIGLSAMFIKWITGIYQATPEALRCLMGYIIDLTLVMDQLFLDTLPLKPPRLLTTDQIDMALENYKQSEAQKVHYEIREYAKKTTFGRILKSNNAQQKVIELIRRHRMDHTKPFGSQ